MFATDFSFEGQLYTCTFELESYSDCFVVIVHLADGNLRAITGINPFSLKYSVDLESAQWAITNQESKQESLLKNIIAGAVRTEIG